MPFIQNAAICTLPRSNSIPASAGNDALCPRARAGSVAGVAATSTSIVRPPTLSCVIGSPAEDVAMGAGVAVEFPPHDEPQPANTSATASNSGSNNRIDPS